MVRIWSRFLLIPLALGTTTLSSPVASPGCSFLAGEFPNQTIFPSSEVYTTQIEDIWSQTCIQTSTCVFQPQSAKDVSTALCILRATNTKFAVRSGGHMPFPGAASITDGVLISMSKLNEISLTDDGVVHVGPGLRWFEVYSWLASHNLTAAGGRFGDVGVGGLLLGGGISYYGSKVGWSANNVINHEVVLADGRIVHANASSEYSDLSWALKGGSENFGIVTRYDMKTFGIQDVWGGTLRYPASSLDAYINAVADFVSPDGGSADPLAAADPLMLMLPNSSRILPAAVLLYNAPETSPAALQDFMNIPATNNSATLREFMDFVKEQNGPAYSNSSKRRLFWVTGLKATPEAVYMANTTFINAAMEQLWDVPGMLTSITYQTITKNWVAAAQAAGGDAIDLDPADGGAIAALISTTWTNPADDDRATQFSENVAAEIEHKAKAAGVHYPWINLNDAGPNQHPFSTYGKGKSLPKMKRIRQKYDPWGVFQRLSPGGFKL